jgi:hypothetical protein
VTTITITKGDDGRTIGFTERDQGALVRWKRLVGNLEAGELLTFDVKFDINRRFHNLAMRLKRDLFEAQEKFTDFDQFRYWLYVGAGHCTWHPGPRGAVVPIPGSFSDKDNDDQGKKVVLDKVKTWCRTGEPAKRLWPHLGEVQRVEMMDMILAPYEDEAFA